MTLQQPTDTLDVQSLFDDGRQLIGGEWVPARGDETIPNVLGRAKSDAVVGKTKVADLLKSLPGYGPAKVNALLEQTGIDASRRAAGLGDRQKQALLDALG